MGVRAFTLAINFSLLINSLQLEKLGHFGNKILTSFSKSKNKVSTCSECRYNFS